jgi:putative DNA primase/helicase
MTYSPIRSERPVTAREVFRVLGGEKRGDGFLCRCPCGLHKNGDRNPSLSVKDGRDRLLLHCFAGGDYRDIVAALRHRGVRI